MNSLRRLFHKIFFRLTDMLSYTEIEMLKKFPYRYSLYKEPERPEYLRYWENQIDFWNFYPSPIRPSKNDLKIYKNFLAKNGHIERVLILGSTPELRDLVAQETKAKAYIADFSEFMPAEMLKFTHYADPLKETWIKDDWLSLHLPEKSFDVILGDLILQQITPEFESAFLRKINLLLKETGFFIARFNFLDSSVTRKNISEAINQTFAPTLSEYQKSIILKLRILWLFSDPGIRKLNREISAKKFDQFLKENAVNNGLLDTVRNSLFADMNSFRTWSPPEERELTNLISRHFQILDREHANDYEYSRLYPIFLLQSKIS